MEPYWETIEQIVRESDILLEIVDARMVELSRNSKLEELITKIGRPKIIVINKSDLVSRNDLVFSIEKLKQEDPNTEVVYVSSKHKRTIKTLLAKIRQVFAKHGKRQTFIEQPIIKKPYREAKGDIVVGVVGYPNVGKSSVINGLAFKKKMKVSSKAGTTHGVHWINIGEDIRLIDTPGVVPLEYTEESRLGMISARSPEKIKDPDNVAGKIIAMFIDNNKIEKIEEFYKIKLFHDEKNPYLLINEIALQKGHVKKGGVPDETRTSIMIIRDWQNGKLNLK